MNRSRSPSPDAPQSASTASSAGRYSNASPELAAEARARQTPPRRPEVSEPPASGLVGPSSDPQSASRPRTPTPPPAQLLDRVVAGDYRVVALINESRLGEVYRAAHARTRRALALKVLAKDLSKDPEAVRRFTEEAEILATLDHPNIVQVVDYHETTDGRPFIAMELLEGHTLRALLSSGELPTVEEVRQLAIPVASALGSAHRQGVVHADLRPHNVFVGQAGRERYVKLLDFGFSRRVEGGQTSASERFSANAEYRAPEQLVPGCPVTPASDQFSLACIVYEMLVGRSPFYAETAEEATRRVLDDAPHDPRKRRPGIPDELAEALLRALSKKPEDRFEKVADFAQVIALSDDDGLRADQVPASFALTLPPPSRAGAVHDADTLTDVKSHSDDT